MRTWIVLAGLAGLARPVAADSRCYAGARVDTIQGTEMRDSVVVRTVTDRAAKTIVLTTWSDHDPDRATTHTLVVDPEHGTYAMDNQRVHETGTLEGQPWQWTAARGKGSAPALGVEIQSEMQLGAGKVVIASSSVRDGKPWMASRLEATAFDCAQLAAKRAALDQTSPKAVHACYEGTSTTTGGPGGGQQPVIIEQVFDVAGKTIEQRHWGHANVLRRFVLAIDGDKLTYTGTGLTGTGSISGKPGAWTAYAWSGRFKMLELRGHGSLGGTKLTEVSAALLDGKETSRTETTAAAFDCAKLAARRDALAGS